MLIPWWLSIQTLCPVGEGHIELLNVDTIANDYYLKIARVGSTGLVDSNAFCFDLCYGAGTAASMGTVNIASGAVSYDFAGYAYTPQQQRRPGYHLVHIFQRFGP